MRLDVLEKRIQQKNQQMPRQNTAAAKDTLNEQRKDNVERLSSKKVLLYASKVWKDEFKSELFAAETSEIIETVYGKNRVFFSGRSEKGILSGIFYLLGRKNNAPKTQREIAHSLNTNVVTVRVSYREWLCTFPDLFSTTL
jgi:hypothetical protein